MIRDHTEGEASATFLPLSRNHNHPCTSHSEEQFRNCFFIHSPPLSYWHTARLCYLWNDCCTNRPSVVLVHIRLHGRCFADCEHFIPRSTTRKWSHDDGVPQITSPCPYHSPYPSYRNPLRPTVTPSSVSHLLQQLADAVGVAGRERLQSGYGK